jgi:hypothetical protein
MRLGRKAKEEEIPLVVLRGKDSGASKVVIWIHGDGKSSLFRHGKVVPAVHKILDHNAVIIAPDVYLTGEFCGGKGASVDEDFAGYTFGYNRPVLANRVHDILTTIAASTTKSDSNKYVHLIGFGKAGPWVLLARALCGNTVTRTAVDADQFDFDEIRRTRDEMMLPGALKYGGIASFAALCAPGELFLHNVRNSPRNDWIKDAYQASGAVDHLKIQTEKASNDKVIDWLLR